MCACLHFITHDSTVCILCISVKCIVHRRVSFWAHGVLHGCANACCHNLTNTTIAFNTRLWAEVEAQAQPAASLLLLWRNSILHLSVVGDLNGTTALGTLGPVSKCVCAQCINASILGSLLTHYSVTRRKFVNCAYYIQMCISEHLLDENTAPTIRIQEMDMCLARFAQTHLIGLMLTNSVPMLIHR